MGTLPAVVVTGEAERAAQRERRLAPVARLVFDEAQVERFGDATVGDVLRRLPGMTFSGPAGVVKDIRLRGLDKGNTLFLINGQPVPAATKDRQFQVDRLPADMIERIEIVRSPSASMDADGIGGAINIVLKQTADNLTRLRAAAGRNGDLAVGDVVAQFSRRFEHMDMVLALSHTKGAEDISEDKQKFNASGAVTEAETKARPTKKGETLLAPRWTWRLGTDRLSLEAFASRGTEDKEEIGVVRNAAGTLSKSTDKVEDKDDAVWRLGTCVHHVGERESRLQALRLEELQRVLGRDVEGVAGRHLEELEDCRGVGACVHCRCARSAPSRRENRPPRTIGVTCSRVGPSARMSSSRRRNVSGSSSISAACSIAPTCRPRTVWYCSAKFAAASASAC